MSKLTVLTINLRRESQEDGRNNWPNRRDLVARLVREVSPQAFGTQEGRRPQIASLSERLEQYRISDRHRVWDPERFYPCVFYRPDALEVLDSGDRWLSETPEVHASKSWGSAFPRLATWARLRAKGDGAGFVFACAHLDHVEARAREGQASVLAALLEGLDPGMRRVVLVGDFNDVPGSAPYRILTRSLRDAWRVRNESAGEQDTWHGFRGEAGSGRGRLDWILVGRDVGVLDAEILRTSYGGAYPSDHYPVLAVLEIPPGPPASSPVTGSLLLL